MSVSEESLEPDAAMARINSVDAAAAERGRDNDHHDQRHHFDVVHDCTPVNFPKRVLRPRELNRASGHSSPTMIRVRRVPAR